MDITLKDLGKIVELPARKEWGSGIICKMDLRCAFIIFDTEDGPAKRFFLDNNPLKLAANQDEPGLVKRGRMKNRKIKVKTPKVISPEGVVLEIVKPKAVKAKVAKLKVVEAKAVKAPAL